MRYETQLLLRQPSQRQLDELRSGKGELKYTNKLQSVFIVIGVTNPT